MHVINIPLTYVPGHTRNRNLAAPKTQSGQIVVFGASARVFGANRYKSGESRLSA